MKRARQTERGVTLVELLVVLLIIALLSTIAVPVYLNRMEAARVRTAQAETRELAMAMDVCAAIHGFYVPLHMLDDMPFIDEINDARSDDVDNEVNFNNPFVVRVGVSLSSQLGGNQPQLNPADPDVLEMLNNWQGPFVNFNRFFMGYENGRVKSSVVDSDPAEILYDLPLDPWGQPYRVFSPIGVMGDNTFNTTPTGPSDWDSKSVNFNFRLVDRSGDQDPYDRWAIVSYGSNQVPNELSDPENADDVVYFFGFAATQTTFAP